MQGTIRYYVLVFDGKEKWACHMLDIIHGMFSPLKDGYFSYIDYVGEGRSVVQNSDMWLQRHRIQLTNSWFSHQRDSNLTPDFAFILALIFFHYFVLFIRVLFCFCWTLFTIIFLFELINLGTYYIWLLVDYLSAPLFYVSYLLAMCLVDKKVKSLVVSMIIMDKFFYLWKPIGVV